MQQLLDECRRHGYVTTLAGRRRGFPDMSSANSVQRAAAERQAINSVVQGSAADIMRKALLAIAAMLPPDTARPVTRRVLACVYERGVCVCARTRKPGADAAVM